MSRRRRAYFIAAALLLGVAVLSQWRLESMPPRGATLRVAPIASLRELPDRTDLNLVVVVIDTLRADHLGVYGYARDTSPRIDALARRGIRFDQVEAQSSWTKASMASFWTSSWPERTRVTGFGDGLAPEVMMPAEILQAEGMRTVGLWRNGWVAPRFGFGQGFSLYHRPLPGNETQRRRRSNPSTRGLEGTDADVTNSAVEFLRGVGSERFFLYLHYMDVHQYVSDLDSPDFGTSIVDFYDSAIHWTDRNVGRLVDVLEESGLADRTVLAIVSDHGESFGEGGRVGHARALFAETQRTPMIITLPFALAEPVVVTEPVANVDLWPTLFAIFGIEPEAMRDGVNLMPLILDEAEGRGRLRGRDLVAQLDLGWGREDAPSYEIASLRSGPDRLLWDRSVDRVLLVSGDSSAAAIDAQKQRLHRILERAREAPLAAPIEAEIDAAERERLRALGYLLDDGPR